MVAAGSISSWAEEGSSGEGSSRSQKQSRQRGVAASRASPAVSYNSPGPEVRGGKMYQHSKGLVQWSPDGRMLAVAVGSRAFIRDRETMEILRILHCVDAIEALEWSKNSDLILCAMYKRGTVEVYQLSNEEWTCRITEGLAGISSAMWSPDSAHVLTITDFNLCLTIWPLRVPVQTLYIKKPKTVAFSSDGKLMAVATRIDCRDHLAIYSTKGWKPLRCFQVDTLDLVSIRWSPDGTHIAVQDTCLSYGLYVYGPDGRKRYELQAYEDALGIKTIAWSPCGRFLAVGSYDQAVRVVSAIGWTVVAEFKHSHPRSLSPGSRSQTLTCYVEEPEGEYVSKPLAKLPSPLPCTKPDPNQPNPKLGVGLAVWSPDGRYLLTRNDNMPCVLWVWDVTDALGLCALLVHASPVRSAQWCPSSSDINGPQLAIVKGGQRFFVWTPSAPPCWYDVPSASQGFEAIRVRWAPDGDDAGGALAIMTHEQFYVCSLQQ